MGKTEKERQLLVSQCRYYKGEGSCPYNGKGTEFQNEAMLWFYEQTWVFDMVRHYETGREDEAFKEAVSEYNSYGLKGFCESDGIPVTLKALLYNRYAKGAFSMADAVEGFKGFYRKYYSQ